MSAFRMPGFPVYEYPDNDKERLNLLFIYLFKFRNSHQFLDKLVEYLGWEVDQMEKLKLKLLLDKCPHVEAKKFGNTLQNTYKIKDEAVLGIDKYKTYNEWLANNN